MSRDLLIEIGTEEMPSRFIDDAVDQLANRVSNWLTESNIEFNEVVKFSTPRRLAIVVKEVADTQEDLVEEVRGPSVKIAKDEAGNWTKAAQGFARGQGLSVDEMYIQTVKGTDYVFLKKEDKGQPVEQLLPNALKEIIQSMSFPKNMRWGSQELKYVRPIRWMVLLFGNEVIEVEVAGVHSGTTSRGHRFLGGETQISSPAEYEEKLKAEYVIANHSQRKEIIIAQIKEIETQRGWKIPIDEELLNEVVNLVEYPTALFGSFKEEYLEIPSEVLVTTMREHQRYFPVEDGNGSLLPYFVTVRNGNDQSIDIVRKGNEKVLTARLADARFFYLEDQKIEISDAISKLEHIVFQEELGSIGDKVRRIKDIAHAISDKLKLDEKLKHDIERTAEICKFDLVTNMVYEFPELQGFMGEKYARIHGEKEEVAKGVFEHYLPRFSGDNLPESMIGQILSIADKLDNIVGSFSLGKIPTGSQDPLGLRRQAAGIVQILFEKVNEVYLDKMFELTLDAYDKRGLLKRNRDEVLVDLADFFTLRLKNLLQERGIRYDIIDAALETDKNNIKQLVEKATSLSKKVNEAEFKHIVDAFTRVMNIATKTDNPSTNPSVYVEDEERRLYERFEELKQKTAKLNSSDEVLDLLTSLKEPIDAYFEKVMVMVENDELRMNRLGLMLSISNYLKSYADFSKLVFA